MDLGKVTVGAEAWRAGRELWARGPSDARRSEERSAPARRMANAPASWSTVARHRFGTRPRLPINATMVRSLAPCLCASSEPLANNRARAKSNQPLVGNIHAGPQLRRARRYWAWTWGEVAMGVEAWRAGRGLWAHGPSDARRSAETLRACAARYERPATTRSDRLALGSSSFPALKDQRRWMARRVPPPRL
jgi:hypothetical protein